MEKTLLPATLAGDSATACSAPEGTLPALFEAQVARDPDAVALIFDTQSLAYGELNARANRLAHHLIRLGVGPESLVGVCLERSVEMVVSLLAVLKAGGAFVPLDPDYPAARLAQMLADAAPAVVLTTSALRLRLAPTSETIVLDSSRMLALLAAGPVHDPTDCQRSCTLQPLHPAYVIYTSGSTGMPKGAINTHQGLVNRIVWMQAAYHLDTTDRVLQKTPYSFDVSVWEFFWPLLFGAGLVVALPGKHRDSRYLVEVIVQEQITNLHFVPPMLQAFLQQPDIDRCCGLRRVICSGDALSGHVQSQFFSRLGGVELHNLYGPTEASIEVTAWSCRSDDGDVAPPIGYPIWNTRMYVLDQDLEPVAVGVSGELYIAGLGLARGYLNSPGLTALRFVADPHATSPGQRMYRTGDLARWRADGAIEFLGRVDHQVKVRGFRIELGEIETVLAAHPSLAQTAVIAREDGPGSKQLVAYGVAAREAVPDTGALREFLAERLPAHMVPSAFVIMDALPLTPNGKLDRRALPAPKRRLDRYRAPRTPDETALCDILANVLELARVGIDDNFFALGGHSLLATRVIGQARAILGVELPIRTIFEAPTVAELATRLHDSGIARAPIVRQARPDRLPVSFAQQRLWFLYRMEGPSATYNIPMALRFDGALDHDALKTALADVVARHESLRTIFSEQDGVPLQDILPVHEASCELAAFDIAEAELAACLAAAVATSFDLAREIPIRAWLFRISPERHVLLVLLHHIASDGWSLGPLGRDLARAYIARHQVQAPNWVELPIQYADYTIWQRELLGEDDAPNNPMTGQLAFWRRALAGVPDELSLPFDHPRPPVASHRGATVHVRLSVQLHRRLLDLAHAGGASLFMVLQAGLAALLARLVGSDDIAVGTAVAGRGERALEDLVGFFVNTLVIRTDLAGDPTFRELVSRVRAFILDAYAYQDVPFERVVEALHPARSLARHPLFQVMFVLQNTALSEVILPGLAIHEEPIAGATSKFDLMFSLREIIGPGKEAAGIDGVIEYSRDLFDQSTVEMICARFIRMLEQAAASPDEPMRRLDMLEPAERRKLLEGFNATACPTPEATISKLFEAQVARDPDAVALICGTESLSYRDLNARANRVAHHFMNLGVRRETLVGVCIDRSFDMVAALLAILKAGAAYVPIAPELPALRRDTLVADAGLRHMLTTPADRDLFVGRIEHVVSLDDVACNRSDHCEENPGGTALPSSLAYLNYTSGTTGVPNAVAVPHLGVVRLVHEPNYVCLDKSSRLLQMAPLSFDAATFEIWGALLNGGTLVIMPSGPVSPQDLGDVLMRHQVNTLWLTAGFFDAVVSSALPALAGVRQLLAGGDVLAADHVDRVLRTYPDCRIINGYGPTENTTFTCCFPVPPDRKLATTVPIGFPINNTRVYILDRYLEPVPVGVTGELYAAGLGLARGYLNRPGLTALRFLADPHATSPGQRMYRTGDLARWRPDGAIEFLGRVDHQVKVRGFRLELGAIETALAAHPGVSQAAVIARDNGPGGKRLAAYVVPAASAKLDPVALRHRLARALPEYMVPADFVIMNALPLTPNGKLDRRALSEQGGNGTAGHGKPVRPRTLLELDLLGIWQRLFERDNIGLDDHFFDLGGHSLLAARLVAEIDQRMNMRLPIAALFQSPTVAALARMLSDEAWAPSWRSLVPMQPVGSGPVLFCVHGLGGEVYDFLDLARELAGDRKVYGLQAVGLDGRRPRHTSVEQMAAHYAREIRSLQPDGPYHLMGHSLGGWIAYAVAQELTRQGTKVGPLALLDTDENCVLPWNLRARQRLHDFVARFQWHHDQLRQRPPADRWSYFEDRWRNVRSRLAIPRQIHPVNGAAVNPAHTPKNDRVIDYFQMLVARYRPGNFIGDVNFFLGADVIRGEPAFWKRLVRGRLRVHRAPGNHLTLIDKSHAKGFAQILKQTI